MEVIVLDDSIVRGSTLKNALVPKLCDLGAKKVVSFLSTDDSVVARRLSTVTTLSSAVGQLSAAPLLQHDAFFLVHGSALDQEPFQIGLDTV